MATNTAPEDVFAGAALFAKAVQDAHPDVALPEVDFDAQNHKKDTIDVVELYASIGTVARELVEGGWNGGAVRRMTSCLSRLCLELGIEEINPASISGPLRTEIATGNHFVVEQVGPIKEPRAADNYANSSNRKRAEKAERPDALGAYMEVVGRYRVLKPHEVVERMKRYELGREARLQAVNASDDEQAELLRLIEDGDVAEFEMRSSNLRLVVSIARPYALRSGMDVLDLIQHGNEGLRKAIGKFEWRKGFNFSTYATWWIRQSIQRAVKNEGRAIRLPVHVHDFCEAVSKRLREASVEDENYTLEKAWEDVRDSKLKGKKPPRTTFEDFLLTWNKYTRSVMSLDAPLSEDGEATLVDVIAGEGAIDEVVHKGVIRDQLSDVLSQVRLTEREQEAVVLRYLSEPPLTLEELGDHFGVTRERARQITEKALTKLRHPVSGLNRRFALALLEDSGYTAADLGYTSGDE